MSINKQFKKLKIFKKMLHQFTWPRIYVEKAVKYKLVNERERLHAIINSIVGKFHFVLAANEKLRRFEEGCLRLSRGQTNVVHHNYFFFLLTRIQLLTSQSIFLVFFYFLFHVTMKCDGTETRFSISGTRHILFSTFFETKTL